MAEIHVDQNRSTKTVAVSLAILTYKNNQELERCLSSVFNFDFEGQLEVIIVDNSVERCAYPIYLSAREKMDRFTWVYISSSENNIGRARQLAIEVASASAVAFLDSDCVASADWLSQLYFKLCDLAQKDSQVAAVGGPNEQPQIPSDFYESLAIMRSMFIGHMNSSQMVIHGRNSKVDHLSTCNVIYNKNAVLKVSNFSQTFSRYGEDLDLSYRLRRAKYSLYFVNELRVTHYDKNNFRDWSARAFRFGRAQVKLIQNGALIHILNRRVLLPLGFISIVIAEGAFYFGGRGSGYLFGSYLIATASLIFVACLSHRRLALFHKVSLLLWASHLSYAFGQLYQMIAGRVSRGIS